MTVDTRDSQFNNPDNQYPQWERSWTENLSEVDDQIVDWFRTAREKTAAGMSELGDRIKYLFDKKEFDPVTRGEYEKVKGDGKLWAAKVENRVNHLVQDGKIAWARMTGQDKA